MAIERLAGSCDSGPCPTLYIDTNTADVTVQGYVTTLPQGRIPTGEDVVQIPAEAWTLLLSRLPVRMLMTALVGKLRQPRTRALTSAGR